jgi:hypothetical protein
MAQTFAANATNAFNTSPPLKSSPSAFSGRVRVLSDTITYASQATSDTVIIGGGKLPIGAQVLFGLITTTVSTGSTTVAIGSTASASKYKAAAVYTTVDVPQLFGVTAGLATDTTVEEQIMVTFAAATAPASGSLKVELFYVTD